jgi:DNA-binding MarR family transcriptional regulator
MCKEINVDSPPGDRIERWNEVSGSTGHLLRLARQKWGAAWNRESTGGLTTPQFTVLTLLAANTELDQQTIGSNAGLDKSTIGQIIDKLEATGRVRTRIDPSSRRRKLIGITAIGLEALDNAAASQRVVHARMVAALSASEERELQNLLRRIVEDSQDG